MLHRLLIYFCKLKLLYAYVSQDAWTVSAEHQVSVNVYSGTTGVLNHWLKKKM